MRSPASLVALVSTLLLGCVAAGHAETIRSGEVRTVTGTVSAVDADHRAVVVEVPAGQGASLTIGVTLRDSVRPLVDGQTAELTEGAVGRKARLTYSREGNDLVGLELRLQP